MHSFKSLSLLFTLGFAAFASAAPIEAEVKADVLHVVKADAEVEIGHRTPGTVFDILHHTTEAMHPLCDKLYTVTVETATVEYVQPITHEMEAVLKLAISDLKALVGQPFEVAFGVKADILNLGELGKIIAGLLCLVFEVLGYVLGVIGNLKTHVIFPLLCIVGGLVGEIIALVIELLGGVVGALFKILFGIVVPLLAGIVHVILCLDIKVLIKIFVL